MKRVITYQSAYYGGPWTVCAEHEGDPTIGELGPVSYGQHWGHCIVCAAAPDYDDRTPSERSLEAKVQA